MEFIFDGLGIGVAAFYTVYSLAVSSFGIASYVLRALGLYTIAKRRGINHPWMSWVPVLDLWVLGCISDQYRYVVKGEFKNKRKVLLVLNIIIALIAVAMIVLAAVIAVGITGGFMRGNINMVMQEVALTPALIMLALCLPLAGVAIVLAVVRYMAMYDLYTSCSPQNNVLFLVLSIFFTVTEPFFVFFLRNKDEGMPPRRQQPQYIPDYEPRQEAL